MLKNLMFSDFAWKIFFRFTKFGKGVRTGALPCRPPILYGPGIINKLNNLGLSDVELKKERELSRKVQFVK